MIHKYLPHVVIFVATISNDFGQGAPADCGEVLKLRTTHWKQLTLRERLATLNLVDTDKWETEKNKYRAIVPGYFDGTAEQFKQKRDKVYQFSNYTSDKSSSEAELKIDIPKGAIPAWSDCINKDQLGLSVYLREADENTATIEIVWRPPVGLSEIVISKDTILLENVQPNSNLEKPITLKNNDTSGNFLVRRANKSLASKIVINGKVPSGGTYAAGIVSLPPKFSPPHAPCIQTTASGRCSACSWDKRSFRGKANDERSWSCPNMGKGQLTILATKIQLFQEGWTNAGDKNYAFNNVQELRRNSSNWSHRLSSPGQCGVSAFNTVEAPLGSSEDGEDVEIRWKALACDGCGGAYDCGAELHDVLVVVR